MPFIAKLCRLLFSVYSAVGVGVSLSLCELSCYCLATTVSLPLPALPFHDFTFYLNNEVFFFLQLNMAVNILLKQSIFS